MLIAMLLKLVKMLNINKIVYSFHTNCIRANKKSQIFLYPALSTINLINSRLHI